MTHSKIIDRLCQFGPPVVAASARTDATCIASTAAGIAALNHFGVQGLPLSVHVDAWNQAAWDLAQEMNFDEAAWRRLDAFTISTTRGEILKPIPGRAWIGHLVIHVPAASTLIDLTLGAQSRPARGIPLPDVGTFHWPRGTCEWTYGAKEGARLRFRVRQDEGHDAWRCSPDWQHANPDGPLALRIAKAIRANRL